MESCDNQTIDFIEDFRDTTWEKLEGLKNTTANLGLWAPACIQHGFTRDPSFTSQNYQVKGVTILEAVTMFLEDPSSPPWIVDEISWPENIGCNGIEKMLRRN